MCYPQLGDRKVGVTDSRAVVLELSPVQELSLVPERLKQLTTRHHWKTEAILIEGVGQISTCTTTTATMVLAATAA